VNSPQLLMLSGVGPREHLQVRSIDYVLEWTLTASSGWTWRRRFDFRKGLRFSLSPNPNRLWGPPKVGRQRPEGDQSPPPTYIKWPQCGSLSRDLHLPGWMLRHRYNFASKRIVL
jgi:hypothetical protein